MKPYSPLPRFVRGENHSRLIQRVIRRDVDHDIQRIDLITTTSMRLSLVDSGMSPLESTAEGDTCVHVLWQADEENAWIAISGERFPVAPGDSVAIPMGDSWQLSQGQLAVSISRREASLVLPVAPTHGVDRFEGYNRESRVPAMSISRWKLTGPLAMEDSGSDRVLVSLFGDIAIRYQTGISMLHQGEASVIRAGMGRITLVPNGLTYVLVVD